MAERRLDAIEVTVDGRPLAPELYPRLRLARVEETVQLPDSFTLRFEDAYFELFDSGPFRPGVVVEIAFRADQDAVVVTEGEVVSLAVEPGPGGRHELVVGGLDRAHRLARGTKSRSFLRMSDAAIVRQIADEHGLDADVTGAGDSHEYVLQAGRTDLAFLRERAALIGHDVWVTAKTLHFRPRPTGQGTPPALRWGENLLSFRARFASAERCDEVIVRGWDRIAKKPITGRATAADADPGSDAGAVGDLNGAARRAFGTVVRETGLIGVGSQAEADALALSLMRRAGGSEVVLRGEVSGDPRLGAGLEVKVEKVGTTLAGTYRLTSAEHVYGSHTPYVTRVTCGAKDPSGLVDLFGADPGALGVAGAGHGAALVVGQVTNTDDPDGLARVKVRVPSISVDDESHWARVVAPGAGPGRGLQWMPEVGDEVLVGYEYADLHRPVVFGGLWNREDKAPEAHATSSGQTTTRVLASRRNHRLTLVDDPEGEVRLGLGDASSALTLTATASELHGEQALRITGQTVEVSAGRKLVLSAPQIEIGADSALTLKGKPIKLN